MFHLADHQGNANAFRKAREIVAEWRWENVLFQGGGVSQIENTRKFDLVALADILHRAEHPEILVRSARDAAREFLFVTLPLAAITESPRDQPEQPPGVPLAEMRELFPTAIIRGCYW